MYSSLNLRNWIDTDRQRDRRDDGEFGPPINRFHFEFEDEIMNPVNDTLLSLNRNENYE